MSRCWKSGRRPLALAGGALWLLAFSGCEAFDPEVGEERTAASVVERCNQRSDAPGPVRFSAVSEAVFQRGCGCHQVGGIGLVVGGLDLTSHAGVIAGGNNSRQTAAVPGDACASVLVAKLGPRPPFGARMPFDGTTIADENLQLIIDWIIDGAQP